MKKKIVKIRELKQPWSHCHLCGKDAGDKGFTNAEIALTIDLPHGGMIDMWLHKSCLRELVNQLQGGK